MENPSGLPPQGDLPKSSNDHATPKLSVEAAESFNYAAWQNSVPLLRSVVIDNAAGPELNSLRVELKAQPEFSRPKQWTIDRISAAETYRLRNIDLEIDPAYLNGLDEAERGTLTLQLWHQGKCLSETTHPIRVLARDEWGGMSGMGNLLPAFITPNDPAIAPLLVSAANTLSECGHPSGLDGYQSSDPNRAYLLAAALWSAITGRSLIYANPPGSFEREGQKTRRVGTVLADRLATCLDTTLLFGSGLEAIGLNPVVVMMKGHCFAGVWLVQKAFRRLVETDVSEVRKALAARELVVFETTLVTHRPPAQFTDAVAIARQSLAEEKEDDFVAVIDVSRARMSQVLPLASHVVREESEASDTGGETLPLPASPGIALPAPEIEQRPSTPAGRIERWQRKLLDLSLRNQLLNFRATRQTVPVLCLDISRLEDRLAEGARLRLVSLAEGNPKGQRDTELHQRRTKKDLDLEFVRQAFDRDEVICPVEQHDLDIRLTALFRKIRSDLAEGGSNTLYLAVGFLRWKQNSADEKTYRAPLLLVPVTLARRSASSPYYLTSHEEEVRFNSTLVQLLKKDFDCDLSAFEASLPTDGRGINVSLVLEHIRQVVRDIPGFEVMEEAAISPFSFAKYLMWKDLVDRVGQLQRNRVVRHLIQDPDKAFVVEGQGPMPQPQEMDFRYSPAEIVHPLPADSSQLAAVLAASEGHDLVIVGPPGTGKSQTIANLITQCLAVGKTVLFVAEKTAALDVVHRRLREHGMGDCCVELHSNKAERRRFLDQLEASWKNRGKESQSEWITINNQLRIHRDHLNAYTAAIHTPESNGWTAFQAMGECVRGRNVVTPPLSWPSRSEHNREQYAELEETTAKLATVFRALPAGAELPRLEVTDWSISWETNLLETCRLLADASASLLAVIKKFAVLIETPAFEDVTATRLTQLYSLCRELIQNQLPPAELLLHTKLGDLQAVLGNRVKFVQQLNQAEQSFQSSLTALATALGASSEAALSDDHKSALKALASELIAPALPPAGLVFHSQFDQLGARLGELKALIDTRNKSRELLQSRAYSGLLLDRIDVEAIEREWKQANEAFWPFSLWKRNAVKRKIKAYMTPVGVAEPELDLSLLAEYRQCREQLAEKLTELELPPQLHDLAANDPSQIIAQLPSTLQLRDAICTAGFVPKEVGAATNGHLEGLVESARRLHSLDREVESCRLKLTQNFANLDLSPHLAAEVEQEPSSLSARIETAANIRRLAGSLGITGDALNCTLQGVANATEQDRRSTAVECCRSAKAFQEAWAAYTAIAKATPAASDSASMVRDAGEQAKILQARRGILKQWTSWLAVKIHAEQLGLRGFVEQLQSRALDPTEVASRFRLAYARWWLPRVVDKREPIRRFQKFLHEDKIEDFRRFDSVARRIAASRARHSIQHELPTCELVPRKSELGLLRHQMTLKRPSKAIREIISGMPEVFGKLAPCLLMSPLSIAQYLPADQALFDVVVFDEASQIATWDAIGAIARGKQTIIVGDPKQLPPTNFFGRTESDEGDQELADHEKDLESILDEAQASGLPTLQLNWHYRSRHESLIAFSNWNYYGNRLVTFPAADSVDRGVSLRHIKGALFDRGKSRTNRQEAEAIVADLVARMKRCLLKPDNKRLTYGVVTFNSQQQELIQDLLDEAQRKNQELDWFFSDERIEPTVVKNLENVQGDERDVMLFSITFGFDAAGKFYTNFGALNRDGGERRLNVAITRARQELIVYSSFLPEQLAAERSSARGVHDLKSFLQYAHEGPLAMVARVEGSQGDFDSPLEEAIALALTERGWHVETQVGVSGFRIDLGIVHPDKPGAYLAGIECDGATYHRSAVARDRDKTREEVLTGLGWKILRVWSTDWWYDSACALEEIHIKLNAILENDRSQKADVPIIDAAAADTEQSTTAVIGLSTQHSLNLIPANVEVGAAQPETAPALIARQSSVKSRCEYVHDPLRDSTEFQERFFDADYSETVRKMALLVLASQGPIRDDMLVREVAKAHGFARTGNRIKQRVLELLPGVTSTDEAVGRFLWPGSTVLEAVPFRYSTAEAERRNLDEISMPELVGLVREHPTLLLNDDPAIALARELGLARLSQAGRQRLEEAMKHEHNKAAVRH